jgi:putative glutamine amidotransferase
MGPRIGIAPDLDEAGRARVDEEYVEAVRRAGGEPLALDPAREEALASCGALVLCGGAFDIPPEWYGQAARARIDPPRLARSRYERALLERAGAAGLAVLGICNGAQLMAVSRGGSLVQDLATEHAAALDHERGGADRARAVHPVALEADSRLAELLGASELAVNSSHHQAIDRPGRGVRVIGRAPDRVVEAIEDPAHAFWIGVQWHPERLRDEPSARLFAALVAAAETRRRA